MTDPQAAIIAQGAFARLRDMQKVLQVGGLEAEIINPPGSNANT